MNIIIRKFIEQKFLPQIMKVARESYEQGAADMQADRYDTGRFLKESRRNFKKAAKKLI